MAFDPETAYAALFARIASAAGFKTMSRRLEPWDTTPPPQTPAFFMAAGSMSPEERPQMAPLWKVRVSVVVYAQNTADPNAAPSIQLNGLIAAVVNTLAMQPGEASVAGAPFIAKPPGNWGTTLGGLCDYCRVSGTIDIAEGLLGNAAAAVIPIEMRLSS